MVKVKYRLDSNLEPVAAVIYYDCISSLLSLKHLCVWILYKCLAQPDAFAKAKTNMHDISSHIVTKMLAVTLTVREQHAQAGWLVVNHCFQVLHFLSP